MGSLTSGHRARKRFGQHFLHDDSVIEQIVTALNPSGADCVVEIGPGLGALTVPLLRKLEHLHVIELDRDLAPKLQRLPNAAEKITVHVVDALKVDFADFRAGGPLRVIGNLPYNITTPLLFHLLTFGDCIHDMHFMLQREVVMRLVAEPSNKAYGRLSVMMQYHCAVDWLFDVPPRAFHPPPKVDSAVVRLAPHRAPPVEIGTHNDFEQLLRHAFSQRRKTLRNNLKSLLSEKVIEDCGVDPGGRAETLDMAAFASLSRALGAGNGT